MKLAGAENLSPPSAPMPDVRHGVARRAVLFAPGDLRLCDFTPPHPGPGELLLRVKCALSCGTDLKTYRRGHPMWRLPTPFGHEFAGVVVEAGEGVTRFKAGDELMAAPTAPCEKCFFCLRGQENLCPQAMEKMVMGAYADFLLLPAHVVARNAFRKPPALAFEEAALLEPLSCIVHAQALARPAARRERADNRRGSLRFAPPACASRERGARGRGRGTWRESPGMGGTARRRPRDRCRHGRSRRPKLRGSTEASALTW